MTDQEFEKYQAFARLKLEGRLSEEDSEALAAWLNSDDAMDLEVPPAMAEGPDVHGQAMLSRIRAQIAERTNDLERAGVAAGVGVETGLGVETRLGVETGVGVATGVDTTKGLDVTEGYSFGDTAGVVAGRGDVKGSGRRVPMIYVWAAGAAAVIALCFVFGPMLRKEGLKPGVERVAKSVVAPPGGNRAVLILSNGQSVDLQDAASGVIAREGAVNVEKTEDGKIAYQQDVAGATPTTHTLQTPRGGQYQLTLPDGSRVWLNALSSISYPTAFTGGKREVSMTGEAYFEIAPNRDKPFHVLLNGMDIQVLGTHFNANGYMDNGETQVTLLEGAIAAASKGHVTKVKPGQQVGMDAGGTLGLTDSVNLDQVMAWKDNRFDFGEGADIHAVMKTLARWYQFDIAYAGDVQAKVGGQIPRTVDGVKVLQMLEKTGGFTVQINGDKVLIMAPVR